LGIGNAGISDLDDSARALELHRPAVGERLDPQLAADARVDREGPPVELERSGEQRAALRAGVERDEAIEPPVAALLS